MELSAGTYLLIAFGLVFLLMASGMWIWAAMGLVGVFMLFFFVGGKITPMIASQHFNLANSFTFTMFPLFVFIGHLVLHGGISKRLYKGASAWVGSLPGGLLHTNIVTCAIFAAACASSMATAATVGTVAVPELERAGYDRKLTLGSLAAGGTLGILIPPSAAMIVYGVMTGGTIARLFIAGMIPGIVLTLLFMGYIVVYSATHPGINPKPTKFSLRAMLASLKDIGAMALLIFMILGTIYLGVATPTEAAALGAAVSIVLCVCYRTLTWQAVKGAALAAVSVTGWLMLIVIGATIFGLGLSMLKVPAQLCQMVAASGMSQLMVLILVCGVYIILGCFMDGLSMMLLTLPVTYPLMMSQGFDSLWFAVLLVILLEMCALTPPVGMNLYIIHGITGKKYLGDIIRGVIPFFLCMFAMLFVLTAFPALATWLPGQMPKF